MIFSPYRRLLSFEILDAGGLEFSTNGELPNAGVGIRGVSNMEIEAYKMQYSYDSSFPGRLGRRGLHG